MGQYYNIVNVDKKERLELKDWFCNKLMEFSWVSVEQDKLQTNEMLGALTTLLRGKWKGDRVYVVGDYADLDWAEPDCPDNPAKQALWTVLQEVELNEDCPSLYDYGKPRTVRKIDQNIPRYIINTELGEWVDLLHMPGTYWGYYDDMEHWMRIHPLPLLIALGNGQGGGDYYGANSKDVGRWAGATKFIRFSDERPKEGVEYLPGFYEHFTR